MLTFELCFNPVFQLGKHVSISGLSPRYRPMPDIDVIRCASTIYAGEKH